MRQRQHLVIHRKSGAAEFTVETLGDAGFAQRMAELKASALAALGDEAPTAGFAVITCDNCGAGQQVDYLDPNLPPGWTAGETADLCPACSAGVN